MRPVLVTQRVDLIPSRGERRDALDQRWTPLLAACGYLAVPVPNDAPAALGLAVRLDAAGILFSGGNDLAHLGGDAPERDAVEAALLDFARSRLLPVLGVCRGMQFLLDRLGAVIEPVDGHVAVRHAVTCDAREWIVNSYHGRAARSVPEPLVALATSGDGVIEAFRHRQAAIGGIMWHPEREAPFAERDLAMLRGFFETGVLRLA
ncbi:MAG: gamma-glutamyl-gamma-aminobutyrate hydrolase family protein [Alphaproteobacteria bacterium]|nr:gamma-glutamyl-gamma-aminobutyrate hydrolase family protein [Alphaproteobacteria bacterium]